MKRRSLLNADERFRNYIDKILMEGVEKEVAPQPGYGTIYLLYNTVNGKMYVGQTWDTSENRYKGHGIDARHDTSRLICKAITKYSLGKFTSSELSYAYTQEDLDKAEEFWVAFFDTTNTSKGYNCTKGGGAYGKHTPEGRYKCGNGSRGRKCSPEELANRSKGGWKLSFEACKAKSERMKGHVISQEQRDKSANTQRGKKREPFSEDHKARMSATWTRLWAERKNNPVEMAKWSEANKAGRCKGGKL